MRVFRFVAVALAAILAHASPALAQNARQIVTSADGDYFGFDLRTEQNVTIDQCKAVCLGDQSCRAFTYDTRAGWCFLKSDYNVLNPFPGAIAGKVVNLAGEADLGAPPALAFVPQYVVEDARRWRDETLARADAGGAGLVALTDAARDAMLNNDPRAAMLNFANALSITPDDGRLWTGLAAAAIGVRPGGGESSYNLQRAATGAAINGYVLSRTASERASALNAMAAGLERRSMFRPAITAYERSLELVSSTEVQALYADLKRRRGFRILEHTVDSDSASPRVCVQFSEDLVKSGVDYTSFVTVDNAPTTAIERGDRELCVEGLVHGGRYRIVLRPGLPSAIGEVIGEPVALDIYIRDRSPSLRFTGENFILPGSARRGIPVVSVNTDKAQITIHRVGDRSLSRLLTESQFLRQLDRYEIGRLAADLGAPVFEGMLDIKPELNKEIFTAFPVDEALPRRQPGIYVMTAVPEDDRSDDWSARATQWFLVSDIGLVTFAGEDGLSVFARSLDTARPKQGLSLTLVARNNEVLGTSTTDTDGRARFDAGLIRGTGGMAPAVIMASEGTGDFVFLDMTRAGFDLSDRGVEGRASPGAMDVYAWTERGIYRVGETVHAAALNRGPRADAVDNLPLTFIFQRPDGVEDNRVISSGAELGGHAVELALASTAMRGTWSLRIHTDPKSAPIAQKSFLVEDFVPDRIEFDLSSTRDEVAVGEAATLSVDGRYLYGAPAEGLRLEGQVRVGRARERDTHPGYLFGLADEEDVEDARVTLEDLPRTDGDGKASFGVTVDAVPSTTQFLRATVSVRMLEGGGRAVERSVEIDVTPQTAMLGLKPEFEGSVPEGGTASFRVLALDPKGERVDLKGLGWTLTKLDRHYQWYRSGASWSYEPITTTSRIQEGEIDASATSEPQISVPVTWGRYRLEIETADADGPATSIDFEAGWYVEASSTETPDALELALDKDAYAVGETAKLNISPRFAGEALITIGAESVLSSFTTTVPEGGATIDVPVTEAFGAGAYVMVTLFRPGEAEATRLPMRAIGLKWLKVDPGQRRLSVAIEAPARIEPRQPLVLPVAVSGLAPGEEAYVTVAAVDVGILNLTRYEAPDPTAWYFGQRMLGLEMRDIYGRLIDGSQGAFGRLRTGGDGGAMGPEGNPPTEKLVAFFSGIVRVDDEGRASVAFDIPQFNGTVRVMAVAWSRNATGNASEDVIVRDPVVVSTSLPRFMAPGDQARLLVEIANTDGPAGEYRLALSTGGSLLSTEGGVPATVTLPAGGKTSLRVPLTADVPGTGEVLVALTHAGGMTVNRTATVPVRPGVMPVTTRRTVTLAANGGSLRLDGELFAGSLPQGASVALNVSRMSAFDVPALLMSLDRYPYGCAEQTTSRALPLLYVSELSKAAGLDEDAGVRQRIEDAIGRVLTYQSSSGSFGLWRPSSGDLWLDAYVTDFLTRAREQGFEVPEQAMSQALMNLQNALGYTTDISARGNEIAYALYVLSRNRKASAADLRYYSDTQIEAFASPMARAQLAASLALYGDAVRSEAAFGSAYRLAQAAPAGYTDRSDYGSKLRDGAAMLALAAESRPAPALIPRMITYVSGVRNQTQWTSTQDEAWMLLAARAIQQSSDDIRLDVDGAAHQGAFARRLDGMEVTAAPLTIVNSGSEPVDAILTVSAAPEQPLPAGGEGFSIERAYYTLAGEPANVFDATQNERYVVVLKVREFNDWPSRILVSDLLPAGFEIDNPRLVDTAALSNFDWLPQPDAVHTEFRDDRFIAAFDRASGSDRDINLAYVVRAVTPGVYTHPAATVEDMYRPQLSARTASGMMEVRGE